MGCWRSVKNGGHAADRDRTGCHGDGSVLYDTGRFMSQPAMVTQDIRHANLRPVAVAAALLAAVAAFAFVVTGIDLSSSSASRAVSAPAHHGFSSLPVAARGAVARGLGADDRRFWAQRSSAAGTVTLRNPAQHLHASFDDGSIAVRGTHGVRFGLAAPAIGRPGAVTPVHGQGVAHAAKNRVTFSKAGVQEWFANGPWGIEQGFTLAHRAAGSGPLMISQTITGTMTPHVNADH